MFVSLTDDFHDETADVVDTVEREWEGRKRETREAETVRERVDNCLSILHGRDHEIMSRVSRGELQCDIAKDMGVSRPLISLIVASCMRRMRKHARQQEKANV